MRLRNLSVLMRFEARPCFQTVRSLPLFLKTKPPLYLFPFPRQQHSNAVCKPYIMYTSASEGARLKEKATYTPSRCQNEKETSTLGFVDEFTKERFVFFCHICILLGFSIPPHKYGHTWYTT